MDTQTTSTTGITRPHPIVIAASIAVILLSATGIGAILGWIPIGASKHAEPAAAVTSLDAKPTAGIPAGASPAAVANATTSAAPAKVPARPQHKPAATINEAKSTPAKAEDRPTMPAAIPVPTAPGPMASNSTIPMPPPSPAPIVESKPICLDCGVVELVRETEKAGEGSGVGAVAGTVVGGVLGNQVGKGNGRDAMTILGAIGGAIAGHQIEKSTKKTKAYEIVIRLDDGTTRTLSQSSPPAWRAGDHVKVLNGVIVPNA
jgi:outer membrane lipoprotein SlyB